MYREIFAVIGGQCIEIEVVGGGGRVDAWPSVTVLGPVCLVWRTSTRLVASVGRWASKRTQKRSSGARSSYLHTIPNVGQSDTPYVGSGNCNPPINISVPVHDICTHRLRVGHLLDGFWLCLDCNKLDSLWKIIWYWCQSRKRSTVPFRDADGLISYSSHVWFFF